MKMTCMRDVRERKMITQAELAEHAGISRITINRLETGQQEARISTVRKLAAALGVEVSEIVDEWKTGDRPA